MQALVQSAAATLAGLSAQDFNDRLQVGTRMDRDYTVPHRP